MATVVIKAGFIDEGISSFISQVGDYIRVGLGNFFSVDWIPEIYFWYWWLFILIFLMGIVIYFFGWSKIVRVIASMIVLGASIFVAGGYYMQKRLAERAAAKAARNKPKPTPSKPPRRY